MDLEQFHQEAKNTRRETKKIFNRLKKARPKALDSAFHQADEEVFSKIDCLNCANCCKTTGPLFTDSDIDRLAKHLKMSARKFMDTYLRLDEDGDWVLQTLPCPFLGADNYCSVYEARPKACKDYPHTQRRQMHKLLKITEKNAPICPAV